MLRKIDTIIIHCAVTRNGAWLSTESVDPWHHVRKFKRKSKYRIAHNKQLRAFGYHYLITDGMPIATGRHLDEIGAHARGHNTNSIGICLAGTDKFTLDQWDKLQILVSSLLKLYPKSKVIAHHEVSDHKTCPNFDVAAWLISGMHPIADNLLE